MFRCPWLKGLQKHWAAISIHSMYAKFLAYAESDLNDAIHAMQVMNMSDEVHPATALGKVEICKLVCHIASFVGIKLSNFWPFPIARLMSGAAIPVDLLSTATQTLGTPITVGETRQRIANSFGVPV